MIRVFTYQPLPMRVVFAPGAVTRLAAELGTLGLRRVLVICSPEQQELGEKTAATLGDTAVGVVADARMHVPVEVVDRAGVRARELAADATVAVGGGSAIGLAKALALRLDLPIVAVPTTYAGSEMTPIWGLTSDGEKQTGRDPRVLPRSVVYDPELTVTLPPGLSLTSAMNAIAHAAEALYAPDLTPLVALQAEEGVRAFAAALPEIIADGTDLSARSEAQYAAWLCGACLAATTMSLHHKLCHVLGGTLDLPHAQTHTVVLPYVLRYNAAAAPEAMAALRRALAADDPADALWRLAGSLGAPRSLRELGMARADVARVVDLTLQAQYANPRPVTREGITRLLTAAWAGDAPGAAACPSPAPDLLATPSPTS